LGGAVLGGDAHLRHVLCLVWLKVTIQLKKIFIRRRLN
jgi:hypothetical protein